MTGVERAIDTGFPLLPALIRVQIPAVDICGGTPLDAFKADWQHLVTGTAVALRWPAPYLQAEQDSGD